MTVRRSTGYTIILGWYVLVLAVLGASAWTNDEWPTWAGLILFAIICMLSAVLITLNEH